MSQSSSSQVGGDIENLVLRTYFIVGLHHIMTIDFENTRAKDNGKSFGGPHMQN